MTKYYSNNVIKRQNSYEDVVNVSKWPGEKDVADSAGPRTYTDVGNSRFFLADNAYTHV